jgi:hypothetical protein
MRQPYDFEVDTTCGVFGVTSEEYNQFTNLFRDKMQVATIIPEQNRVFAWLEKEIVDDPDKLRLLIMFVCVFMMRQRVVLC